MALQPRGNHAPDGLTRGLVAPVHAVHAGALLDDAVRSRTSEKLVRKRDSPPDPVITNGRFHMSRMCFGVRFRSGEYAAVLYFVGVRKCTPANQLEPPCNHMN